VKTEPSKAQEEPLTQGNYWQVFSHTHDGHVRDSSPHRYR
jgi:hypothetical protein